MLTSAISIAGKNTDELSNTDLLRLLGGWAKAPADILQRAIEAADPEAVRRLALFAKAFSDKVNNVGDYDETRLMIAISPFLSDDFFAVMGASKPVITETSFEEINKASLEMTTAIKAENWKQALQVGIGLAGQIVPA